MPRGCDPEAWPQACRRLTDTTTLDMKPLPSISCRSFVTPRCRPRPSPIRPSHIKRSPRRFNSSLITDARFQGHTTHPTYNTPSAKPSNQYSGQNPRPSACATPNSYMSALEPVTLLSEYHKLLEAGILRGDAHQTRIIQKLQDLHSKLVDYNPPKVPDIKTSHSLVRAMNLALAIHSDLTAVFPLILPRSSVADRSAGNGPQRFISVR